MANSIANEYYSKDNRVLMMLSALGQIIGMLMIPLAVVMVFWDWEIAVIIGILALIIYWKLGDLNVAYAYKWTKFSGAKVINSTVLYAEIENPDTAEKFRFVAENIGGLYREKNDIVLGTLTGEVRCDVSEFKFEAVSKNSLVNYINVSLSGKCFSIFPVWDGDIKDLPSSKDKNDWAMDVIAQLIDIEQFGEVA